jgi:hypothetical protein
MPKLKPLEQWYCDTCGKIIEKAKDGYVVWSHDTHQTLGWLAHSFSIIHHSTKSPGYPERNCDDNSRPASLALVDFVGPRGIIQGLAMVDPGSFHDRVFKGARIRDMREWTEFMRRLHVAHYEEARRYWKRATASYFSDENEIGIFMPDSLRQMIAHFEGEDGE